MDLIAAMCAAPRFIDKKSILLVPPVQDQHEGGGSPVGWPALVQQSLGDQDEGVLDELHRAGHDTRGENPRDRADGGFHRIKGGEQGLNGANGRKQREGDPGDDPEGPLGAVPRHEVPTSARIRCQRAIEDARTPFVPGHLT